MAQEGADLYEETFSCSICLNLLKEPVIIPCGHSYCRTCISSFWDREAVKTTYSCPLCRETFTPRPVLVRNTMLVDIVEKLNKSRPHNAPAVESYATAEDVACDFCAGRKLKAFKSCLVCLASYCQTHLQPHHQSAAFKRHKLVDPFEKLQEKICSRHNEVMKIFCRTDQQCICFLCFMGEHNGHDTVSAAAERSEKQKELQWSRAHIQKNIQDREKDVEMLKQQVKTINVSADQTVEHSEQICTELTQLLQKRSSELKKKVRSKQQTEVSAVRMLQEKLEQKISELKKRDAELQQLSRTEDHTQFLLSYSSLSALSVSTHTSIFLRGPQICFEEVTTAVSEFRDHLHKVLRKDWTKVYQTMERVDALYSESKSRAGFLKYFQEITLDPNTASSVLQLSEGNRKVTLMGGNKDPPHHPDRFTGWSQVLSRQSGTGRCYWEVEWRQKQVHIAVAYKSISRAGGGNECRFGFNNKSWSLLCTPNKCTFYHDNMSYAVEGSPSYKIGVYVDHTAGTLSFYRVSDTPTLLHRVNTTFSEPLHLGLSVSHNQDTAELCTL